MTNIDIETGIMAATANKFISKYYNKFRNEIFKSEVKIVSDSAIVSWDFTKAPVFDILPLKRTEAELIVKATLRTQKNIPEEMKNHKDEYIRILTDSMIASSFKLNITDVNIKVVDNNVGNRDIWFEDTPSFSMIVQFGIENGVLRLREIRSSSSNYIKYNEWADLAVNTALIEAEEIVMDMIPHMEIPSVIKV